ncbi:succinate fumarate mitochondrial transporter [Diplodia corticola]|uniref:Succinate fumarate mitochondrial transporter n=1 Tax=Diplodia corticola TaxID=236234 RepID=A0A1J9QQQ6_9PEZI|nr:succinate fumarate mitochondrial transporter [Diplodia corticola]OJD31270.1 succinate fumarate mitochondrial transporter [Diplodia corticola]
MQEQKSGAVLARLPATTNLIAGGAAGIMEACICHPLDTVKVKMQLSNKEVLSPTTRHGFIGTFSRVARTEGLLGLYRGFDAVVVGMGPKMAVRFASFEAYKSSFQTISGDQLNGATIFSAGLAAGVTEAVLVVNPMEVVKIRLQGQRLAPAIGGSVGMPEYRNALHAAGSVAWREGVGALYQGVALTAIRQGTNQAANFTVYTMLKAKLMQSQPQGMDPPSYQTAAIGLISGAVGPMCNAPIDTIKTRMQNSVKAPGESGLRKGLVIVVDMLRNEGVHAFYKGITPRVIRVAPGQAVTFTVYEFMKRQLQG